jgi:hypothetical protein
MDNTEDPKKRYCDYCKAELGEIFIVSWFVQDLLCNNCSKVENVIKQALPYNGKNFKGCGYIPNKKIDIFK